MKKLSVGTGAFLFVVSFSAMAGGFGIGYACEEVRCALVEDHAVVEDEDLTAILPLPSVGDTLQVRSPLADVEVADLDDSFGTECDIDDTTIEIERISDGIIIAKVLSREKEAWRCTVGTRVMMTRSDWMEFVDDSNRHHEKARAKTERLKRTRDMLERTK